MGSAQKKQLKPAKMAVLGVVIIIGAIIGWQLGYTRISSLPWFGGRPATSAQPPAPSVNSNPGEPAAPTPPAQAAQVEPSNNQPADLTKKSWGYTVKKNQPPGVSAATEQMLSKYGGIYRVKTQEKQIALTFDLGYENGQTEKIVDILAKRNVKAAFFATGSWLKDPKNVKLAQRMVSEGHIIGNHTANHPSLPTLSNEQVKRELERVEEQLKAANLPRTRYMRPPMGEYSENTLRILQAEGYTTTFWSMALRDWVPLPGGSKEYHQTVMNTAHPGAIALLHAVSPDLLPVLDQIIVDLQGQGYQLVSLDQIRG